MIDKRIIKIHAMMQQQHELGIISDEQMHEVNNLLAEAKREAQKASMSAERIRALRIREQLSQSQLAKHLYLTANSVQKWERGVSEPKGAALALLELIEKKGVSVLQ